MNDLISKLGIDWRLLTAQLFNFIVLLLLLRKFLYKPVLEMLHKRRNIISRSLREAKKIEEDSQKMEETKKREMQEARIRAKEIINQATGLADGQKERILKKAKADADNLVSEAKSVIKTEKEQMAKELEKKTGNLALRIMEKYFKENVKKDEQEKIIKNIIAEM